MALIAEYQRSPQLGRLGRRGLGEDRGDDATSASYTELPASYKPVPRRRPDTAGRAARCRPGPAGGGGSGRTWSGPDGPPSGRPWSWSASSSAPRSAAQAPRTRRGRPIRRGCRRAARRRRPIPCAVRPPAAGDKRGPGLCMPTRAWAPPAPRGSSRAAASRRGHSVTVTLTWNSPPQIVPAQTFVRTARVKPVAGPDGTVRLNISQLFPGALQLGQFTVQVTGSGGSTAATAFIVIPVGGRRGSALGPPEVFLAGAPGGVVQPAQVGRR